MSDLSIILIYTVQIVIGCYLIASVAPTKGLHSVVTSIVLILYVLQLMVILAAITDYTKPTPQPKVKNEIHSA